MAEDTEKRTMKVSVLLTPSEAKALDDFREANHWTRSTAAQVLITEGLEREKERA
jgi:hypothetical protein